MKYCGFIFRSETWSESTLGISAEKSKQVDVERSLGDIVAVTHDGPWKIKYFGDPLFPDSICHALYETPKGTIDITIATSGQATSVEDRCLELRLFVSKMI